MKSFPRNKLVVAMAAVFVATAAYAATQITINTPFALSDNGNGDKPKVQRAGDGTLVIAYGDSPVGATNVYDVKAQTERLARDVFVKTCKPSATKTCDNLVDWSAAVNVSNSALSSSITTDWQGTLGSPSAYPGDVDKPNIKMTGPMTVLTWVSKYCPDGDLATAGIQPSIQQSVRYLERDSRIIPFSCTWTSYSTNKGATWSAPIQLSTGVRDAIQDSSSAAINTDSTSASYNKGEVVISWQEDPRGLQLGEADGPGDGASGANVSNGTDVWYTYATVDLSVPSTPADDFVLATAVRLTDNFTSMGIGGSATDSPVFDHSGVQVDPANIENGQAGAARPNIGMVGSNTIVAYEETKGSQGLDIGKFVRYNAFNYAAPPAGSAGCIISDPSKNARRVRFLTQSPTDAGTNGIQLAIFWKEGIYENGGPSDIMVRRAVNGVQPANMFPAVDAGCATSDYPTAIALNNARADNISSNAPTATTANLTDDTEANNTENALAHRGVLRGNDLWVGYSYTGDLVKLWSQLDNYNFWVRKFTNDPNTAGAGTWGNPVNVTNITDMNINVREPRIFGTPKSNTNTGFCDGTATQDATFCQNADVVYLAWGTQQNVSPFDLNGGDDLGVYITVSLDGGNTYAAPVRYSTAMGSYFQDEESAYEAQIVTRPDGTQFYGTWNQANSTTPGVTAAEYASGSIAVVPDPVVTPTPTTTSTTSTTSGGGGGCVYNPNGRFDPLFPALLALGVAGIALRRRMMK